MKMRLVLLKLSANGRLNKNIRMTRRIEKGIGAALRKVASQDLKFQRALLRMTQKKIN